MFIGGRERKPLARIKPQQFLAQNELMETISIPIRQEGGFWIRWTYVKPDHVDVGCDIFKAESGLILGAVKTPLFPILSVGPDGTESGKILGYLFYDTAKKETGCSFAGIIDSTGTFFAKAIRMDEKEYLRKRKDEKFVMPARMSFRSVEERKLVLLADYDKSSGYYQFRSNERFGGFLFGRTQISADYYFGIWAFASQGEDLVLQSRNMVYVFKGSEYQKILAKAPQTLRRPGHLKLVKDEK